MLHQDVKVLLGVSSQVVSFVRTLSRTTGLLYDQLNKDITRGCKVIGITSGSNVQVSLVVDSGVCYSR